ncbi:MAG: quinoprotein dehydrogenase-associated putative ABC transporter substrate-binding protein [Hyphomicrobium sp.]
MRMNALALAAAVSVPMCLAATGGAFATSDLRSYTKDKMFDDLTAAEHGAAKAEARNRKLKSLRVCADPGNMPQSNNKEQGYQNKIIKILVEDLGGSVNFFWRPYHERGLTRETFQNDECDVLLDMPYAQQSLLTTEPIYKTAYVLAYRNDRGLKIENLDDPQLRKLRVGVFQHSGIRESLQRRGVGNLFIHEITHDGDMVAEHQPWMQVQDVLDGKIDIAAIWGPFAGWRKVMKNEPLTVQPVNQMDDQVPLEFELAIGMRPNNVLLKYMLDWSLMRKKDEVAAVLKEYGVPLVKCSRCTVDGDIPSHGTIYQRLRGVSTDRYLKQAAPMELSANAPADQVVTTARLAEWLKEGADLNLELANAVIGNSAERVTYLLDKGAKVNERDNQGYAPMHNAARNRISPIVALLADRGGDVNARDSDGFTPIMHAINRNHVPTIEMLIKKGADTELPSTNGITPLTWAIGDGKYFAAKALIDLGAKPNSKSGKEEVSPLMVVATQLTSQTRTGSVTQGPPPIELAKLLIEKRADVNQASKLGVTALMVAAGHNNAPVIGQLLNAGADPTLKSAEGLTALEIAERAQNENATAALKYFASQGKAASGTAASGAGSVQN